MSTVWDDLRYAARRLRMQPGFSAVAILTLALGLGANVAVFTLVHGLMLRTLPVDRPGELYRLGDANHCCVNTGLQRNFSLFSYPLYEHLRQSLPEFSSLAAFQASTQQVGVRRRGEAPATAMTAQYVSGGYFSTFGVGATAGRLLSPDDDRPGAQTAVVMSHRAWTMQFGEDPAVVGGAFLVNGLPVTVVGIADERFFGEAVRAEPTAIWLPLGQEPTLRAAASLLMSADQHWLYAIGRLAPGNDPAAISSRATGVLQQWLSAQTFLDETDRAEIADQHLAVTPAAGGIDLLGATFLRPLTLLFITSALVLLIACANLANLLLARADRGQASLRAALGASAGRLMRQSLIEGVLVAVGGGLVSLLIASSAARALIGLAFPAVTSLPIAVSPSPVVLAFAFGLAVVTGAVFSAAPAWAMSLANPTDALGGVGRSASERSFVPRRSLVVVQVALSTVLLSGAGLLGRSLGNLEGQPLGFEPAHRTVVQIDPPPLAGDIERLSALYTNLDTSLRRIPGVASATWALYSPMEGRNWSGGISIDGREADPARPDNSSWNRVGPDYFETTGTRIVRGRGILPTDTPSRARVAVVNETFVRLFFERADAVGRRLGIGGPDHAADFEIVGVAGDVKYSNADQPVRPMIFLPMLQVAPYASPGDANTQGRSMLARTVVVETRPGVASIEGDLRRAFAEAAPDVTIISIRSLENQILGNFRIDRLMARLTSVYGLLAVALAALGLYGVTAYGVARRTREIGVRMALGADTTQVVGLVLRGPLLHTGIGLAIGVPLALLGGRAIASQLYGVGGQDPAVIGGAVLVLVVSAVVAAAVPARRASRLDPTHALRAE